jgi:hypothetical protein
MVCCFSPQEPQESTGMYEGTDALYNSVVATLGNSIVLGSIMHSEFLDSEKIKSLCFVVNREYNSSPLVGPNRVEIQIRGYVCVYL